MIKLTVKKFHELSALYVRQVEAIREAGLGAGYRSEVLLVDGKWHGVLESDHEILGALDHEITHSIARDHE